MTEHTTSVNLVNVAAYLPEMARRQPKERAIVWTSGRDAKGRATYSYLTFRQLDEETDRYAHGLESVGIRRGTRVILMVRPSPELFVLTFSLYKIGAVPVLIDPGMGRRRMVECLRKIGTEAFIGIPLAHVLRVLNRDAFASVRVCITVGRRWFWGGLRLADIRTDPWRPYEMAPTRPEDPAAIIFTTGSTGPPKGVLFLHGMFDAQVRILRDHFKIAPGEIDLPTFPLFALFDPALGMTAVIPDMDPTRPALVDPRKIIAAINDQKVTHMFGSPALLNRVGRYGEEKGVKLPTLKRVLSAGAPVPPAVLRRFAAMLDDDAEIHTPYGATEALPVASIGHREILNETAEQSARGAGTCVGRPMPGITVRVIRITDEPIETWSDDLIVPRGEVGEIVVKGPVVTHEYCTDAAATLLAKITEAREGSTADSQSPIVNPQSSIVWHRMGDVGTLDDRGRLWFCGRKAHRVQTAAGPMFTISCEAVFNEHPRLYRSALVGVGEPPNQRPVLCVELEPGDGGADKEDLTRELLEIGRRHEPAQAIDTILYHPAFPVDIRHNAKIFREKLAVWAAERVR